MWVCPKSVFGAFGTIPDQFWLILDQFWTKNAYNIGVRDCPYGICCPWVRGGWGLDALGKIFRRRRRRRRRPRPLLFRQILKKKHNF